MRQSDVFEVRSEQLKLENAQLKKDAEEAARENSQLQLQVSVNALNTLNKVFLRNNPYSSCRPPGYR